MRVWTTITLDVKYKCRHFITGYTWHCNESLHFIRGYTWHCNESMAFSVEHTEGLSDILFYLIVVHFSNKTLLNQTASVVLTLSSAKQIH